jgi:hypothetical protein
MKSFLGETFDDSSYQPLSFYERELARDTQLVAMDTGGRVLASPGEVKRIATFGLAGCTAVAAILNHPDGSRSGYVQHYSPMQEDASISVLASVLFADEVSSTDARLLIMTPGRLGPSGRFPLEPVNHTLTNVLSLTANNALGGGVDVQVYGYEETQKTGATDQGTLMVELLADGTSNIVVDGRVIQPLASES